MFRVSVTISSLKVQSGLKSRLLSKKVWTRFSRRRRRTWRWTVRLQLSDQNQNPFIPSVVLWFEFEDCLLPFSGTDDGETQGDEPVGSRVGGQTEEEEEDRGDPEVEESKRTQLQRSMSPELDPVAVSQSPKTNVECPMCQGRFPAAQIEMHAAYCDGEVAIVHERRPAAECFQGEGTCMRHQVKHWTD